MSSVPEAFAGLVLAAGAGTRYGGPKALVRPADAAPWLRTAVRTLVDGGVESVVVVLGAAAGEASALVPDDPRATVVVATDWAEGMGASLRAGLTHLLASSEASAVVITLVDLPGMPPTVVERLLAGAGPATLRQALYAGRDGTLVPGHPVVVGRDHWRAFTDTLSGDRGGRAYLRAHGADELDCSDLWHGRDVDVSGPGL